MATRGRAFFSRFVEALNARDESVLESLFHPDFVSDLPQSGERSYGFAGFWSQMESYPEGDEIALDLPGARVLDDEDRWAISPGYTVVPLASSNEFTVLYRSVYPGGASWFVVGLVELRDEKLYRMESYFAPQLPAPLAESIAAYQHG